LEGDVSEFEEIQEIRPIKKRFRKKGKDLGKSDKELEFEMVRRDKQREADLEEIMSNPDQERYQTVTFSDHEEEEWGRNEESRPKKRRFVKFRNVWNEEFKGQVTEVFHNNEKLIWVRVDGEENCIDLNVIL